MKRALVVIDAPQEFSSGRVPVEYPSLDHCVENLRHAIEIAHLHGLDLVASYRVHDAESMLFAADSFGSKHMPLSGLMNPDFMVERNHLSAFHQTNLSDWLRDREVCTVTLAGFLAQDACLATANDAHHLGFNVELLADATGASSLGNLGGALSAQQVHEATTTILDATFAAVTSTDVWRIAVAQKTSLKPSGLFASTVAARVKRRDAANAADVAVA